ncbi:MAG: hypothetical protein A3C46_01380 [Deltaproteobacteria bacterium RIFCSPHIGHO2_02_FULL_44_16]|nr:MAG: hypothetical protein A3C46_01380 [Deltaproteobacteria bacterium RIFCSPHIGHO2_02_FULL_44_16]
MKRFFLLVLCIFATSCTGGGSCAGKKEVAALPDTFIWNLYSDPKSIDPGLVQENSGSDVGVQLFEGLTEYHPETNEPVPALATSSDVSSDGLLYTFHLRQDAKWSNGDPVTAHDFEYSWKRALDPKTGSYYASYFYIIKGGQEFNEGKNTDGNSVMVKALDDVTLQVTLKHPAHYFPQMIAYPAYRPVHRKTVETFGDKWTHPEHIVSNGPYKLVSWEVQKEMVAEKNPYYWDAQNVRINRIRFLLIEERETALKKHLEGSAHYTDDIPTLKIPTLKSNPHYHDAIQLATYYYSINTKKKPFDDVRVRQALAMSIEREKITNVLQQGYPTRNLVPPGIPGYTTAKGLSFNPEKARQLLSEAGFQDPKTLKVTLSYNTNENHKLIAEMVQNMWKENLGVEAELYNQEWKSHLKNVEEGNYEVGRFTWIGDYVDPLTFLEITTTASTQNYSKWSNPVYDDLVLVQSGKERDPKKRFELLQQAEEMMLEQAPLIPLYHYGRPLLLDPRVKGFYGNLQDMHPVKFAWFEEEK